MSTIHIERGYLLEIAGELMDGHVSYGLGSKAPSLHCKPSQITKIDCSGFVRYLIYQATDRRVIIHDGSVQQREWCEGHGLAKVDYSSAAKNDGWLRIAFISPRKAHKGSKAVPGHVWLVLNGRTLESHGKHIGPDRRPWDTPVLKQHVAACYKLAQMYELTIGPIQVLPATHGSL
jgi:hypothetical protein